MKDLGNIDVSSAVRVHGRWVIPIGGGQHITLTDAQYMNRDPGFRLRVTDQFGTFISVVCETPLRSRLALDALESVITKTGYKLLWSSFPRGIRNCAPEKHFGFPDDKIVAESNWEENRRKVTFYVSFTGNFDLNKELLDVATTFGNVSTNLREVEALRKASRKW